MVLFITLVEIRIKSYVEIHFISKINVHLSSPLFVWFNNNLTSCLNTVLNAVPQSRRPSQWRCFIPLK